VPALCARADFQRAVAEQMDVVCRESALVPWEVPAKIHLDPLPFTVENGLLTPTFKLKRDAAKVHYKDALEKLLGPAA